MEIKMPSLSPTMTEGTIVQWLKKEGDTIEPGDVLCEIQTDKAVVAFETEEEGILAKILVKYCTNIFRFCYMLVKEDTKNIKIGTLIGLMVAEGEDWKSVEIPAQTTDLKEEVSTEKPATPSPKKPLVAGDSHHISNIGPAVRGLLELYGLNMSDVPATGPKGKPVKGDILKLVNERNLKAKPPKPVPPPAAPQKVSKPPPAVPKVERKPLPVPEGSTFTDLELSNMRITIAKRLTQSKTTIPHSYGTVRCEVDKILAMRKMLKADGIAVSVNDFVIKAVAVALQQCPRVNALWDGQKAVAVPDIDICVAVATDSGLITPIVRGADSLGVEDISKTVRELAGRARQGKLQLHEFQGGSFTISNLGMYGITEFSAIINPPQCGILAVGSGLLGVGETGKLCTKMSATLSYDGRAIGEDDAAEFLDNLRNVLEDPSRLLLGRHSFSRTEL
ncbi:hypothetical protein J437_LFUL005148 [Ladona fulva]|uniref:Dihydrolipoamide acetyltransferase component of pyruvate dehydrogenase complex n=1 Tax=Ladona fulva TaxID=123851 RepID=A0A8K0KFC0_LADFU|nr:hypothetical protein J437_LFUL005148 [Ladona fulva]